MSWFDFNDGLTRAQFRNIVFGYLKELETRGYLKELEMKNCPEYEQKPPMELPDEDTRAVELWRRAIWPKNELDNWDLRINPCAEIPATLTQSMYEALYKKFDYNLTTFGSCNELGTDALDSIYLTMGLVKEHPHIFQIERVMGGPASVIFDTSISCMSRLFKTSYDDCFLNDLKRDKGNAWRAELYSYLLKELGKELELEAAIVYQQHKWLICPFIPVHAHSYIDSISYTTKYSFHTRYGYIPESAKAKWEANKLKEEWHMNNPRPRRHGL